MYCRSSNGSNSGRVILYDMSTKILKALYLFAEERRALEKSGGRVLSVGLLVAHLHQGTL